MFIRENRYTANEYMEVDVIPLPDEMKDTRRNKRRKEKVTRPEQQLLNDKNSFKWMRLALNGNFGRNDFYGTLTFDECEIPLPESVEDSKQLLKNFLTKVRRRYKKAGKDLKYIWVMEYELDEDGNYLKRVHFHFVMTAGIDRDEIEECWSRGNGKNKKSLGYVTIKRIKPSADTGLERLAAYLAKGKRLKKGKKIWNSSRNLERPMKTKNDHKFTRRKLEKMAHATDLGFEDLAKLYPDHYISSIEFRDNDFKGLHLYVKLWKKERAG